MILPRYAHQEQQSALHMVWKLSGPTILGVFLVLFYIALNRSITNSKRFLRLLRSGAHSGSNELQRLLSMSSSDSSVSSEISSDPEYDDLLASVSLLFQQEDDQEEQVNSCYHKHDSGTILARILPKGDIEYEKSKPLQNRRSDAPSLRSLIKEDLSEAFMTGTKGHNQCFYVPGGNSDPKGLIVALELGINITTLPDCVVEGPGCNGSDEYQEGDKKQKLVARQHHLHMHMHRDADESAKRTLMRLQVSAIKKIHSQIQAVDQSLRCDTKRRARQIKVPIHPSEHKLVNKKFHEMPPSLEPSIWVIENSSNPGTGKLVENGEDTQMGKNRALHRSSSQRKIDLTNSESMRCNQHQSLELWKELASYDKSHLYLDLRDNGPLLALEVDACPPTIISVVSYEDFKSRVYVGIPLVVEAKLLHSTNAIIAWFIGEGDGRPICRGASNVSSCSPARSSYTPTPADVDKKISVLIAPMRPGHEGLGFEEAYQFHYAVEDRPFLPLVYPLREFWTLVRATSKANRDCLRVISYNLLADWYAGRSVIAEAALDGKESSSNFYNHCSVEYLRKERRFPLLVFEILSYHPDLICLQEVDSSVYDNLFRPIFEAHGYQGYYSNKASVQVEGCAMFWSLQYFEKAEIGDMHHFHLRDLLSQYQAHRSEDSGAIDTTDSWWGSMGSIDRLLNCNPQLHHAVTTKISQVVQIAKLKLRRDDQDRTKPKSLVVGNTHLFYHPMADHIRLIQATQVCRQLDIIRRQRPRPYDLNPEDVCPIVLCGDLNSHPLSGAVQLLLQGRIGPEHFEAWKYLNEYSWEMGDEDFLLEHGYIGNDLDGDNDPFFVNEAFEDAREDISKDEAGNDPPNTENSDESVSKPNQDSLKTIVFPGTFPKLISGYPQMPEFTNYSVGFDETLDYIFVSEPSPTEEFGLEPQAAAPLPTREQMQTYGAMPNEFMPSDHFSLVCDLSWKHN